MLLIAGLEKESCPASSDQFVDGFSRRGFFLGLIGHGEQLLYTLFT